MKKILDVFNTYTDAYLEYKNRFISQEAFSSFYDLDETEVDNLFKAASYTKEEIPQGEWILIDYFYNKYFNKNYSETSIHW